MPGSRLLHSPPGARMMLFTAGFELSNGFTAAFGELFMHLFQAGCQAESVLGIVQRIGG